MVKENQLIKMAILMFFAYFMLSCDKDMPSINTQPDPMPIDTTVVKEIDVTTLDDGPIDWSFFNDEYGQISDPIFSKQWGHYNVHDPSYYQDDDFVYCYNTDVAFGHDVRPGIQIRRSINKVEWEFVGWAFLGLPTIGANFIRQNGGEPFDALWAPYIMKVEDEYRLYYSLSSAVPRLSVIGLATSKDPKGPFREQGLVVTSLDNATIQTNAIDPTVVVDKNGSHWMYYGSAWDGIYKLELNPLTGLAYRNEDKGVRVAQRGFTGNNVNGNIEGPEIIYNEEFGMYYLFLSYDWLQTKYHVRVGRSENATGPFYDYNGRNMNDEVDDLPMILAPYRFNGHSGWQGVSHPGVFKDDGKYFMGHQGRPGENSYYMIMHVRQMFWTEDGWPILSSQRFADENEMLVSQDLLIGDWESIEFEYNIVPGYADEQKNPDFINSKSLTLSDDGAVSGSIEGVWSYSPPWLTISRNEDPDEIKVLVEMGRDWENEVESTILFTGINNYGFALWGKKI